MRRNRFERVFSLCSGLALATVAAAACSGDAGTSVDADGGGGGERLTALCQEFQGELIRGAPKDWIPALTDPELVAPDSPWVDFLLPTDRVIGIEVDGEYLAVPHNILWHHEIANFDNYGLAVTYCPLTGSSMVFRRDFAAGAEFGSSGLLFNNNLVMYDRAAVEGEDSLWPQMLAGAFLRPLRREQAYDGRGHRDRVGRLVKAPPGHAGRGFADRVCVELHSVSVWKLRSGGQRVHIRLPQGP